MKFTSYLAVITTYLVLLGAQGTQKQTPPKGTDVFGRDKFATNWKVAKGSVGIINEHLYVVVKSASNERNELIIKTREETEERWYGKDAGKPEVVVVYDNKVWSSQSLPDGFDLSKAVVVSFERNKIRYFDFHVLDGGYYERVSANTD